jgi:cation transport ATPase
MLNQLAGVAETTVSLATHSATIIFDPAVTDMDQLKNAVHAAGYNPGEQFVPDDAPRLNNIGKQGFRFTPFIVGLAAALGLVGFYLGLLTLVSDWYNATSELAYYSPWIISLAVGIGVQATLYTILRNHRRIASMKGVNTSLAASGGMSTAGMAACCAHFLVPVLPAIGLPFLTSFAAGLSEYQTLFFALGVLSNLFGIGFMLHMMERNQVFPEGTLKRYLTFGRYQPNTKTV